MGQIKQRIKLNDFLAVKSRIYEIIDEIDQLNQEATKLAETLATSDYRGSFIYGCAGHQSLLTPL